MSVFRRIIKGSGANAVTLTAKTSEQLFLVPILLSAWSVDLYGEWLLISAIPVYFAMSDLGFLQAGSNELARRASQESEENVVRFFREFTAAFTSWSLLLFLVFCLAAILLPLSRWLHLSILSPREATLTFLALALAALVSMNNAALVAGLRVRKLFHIGLLIRAAGAYGRIIATFFLVFFYSATPVEVAMLNLAVRCIEYATCVVVLQTLSLPPSFAILKRRQEKLFPYMLIGLEFMLMPLAYALSLQGLTVVVGTIVGAAAVAVFSTHRTLARMVTTVLQMFVRPLRAEAGLLQRDEDIPALGRLLMRLSRITFWMSVTMGIPLMLFGGIFFRYWTHGRVDYVMPLFLLLLSASFLEGLWSIASSIRLGSNKHRPIVWGFFVISIVGIALAVLLGKIIGNLGVASSVVLSNLAMCVLTIRATTSLLKLSTRQYLGNLVTPPVDEIRKMGRFLKRKIA
ncbi:hypothetical protein [uncultured Martelella sp.]|uniref:lipopolysaccharide biosynthesis protein n=1 Tax=uncultured Martelella sp. TaxID=392331 RepID=UPI0029C79B4A|nr:hypothetical protein [uncultured Martelella sp.]